MDNSYNKMKQIFDCVDAVNMDEYVGCKVEREEGVFKFTQPVITYILKKNSTCQI